MNSRTQLSPGTAVLLSRSSFDALTDPEWVRLLAAYLVEAFDDAERAYDDSNRCRALGRSVALNVDAPEGTCDPVARLARSVIEKPSDERPDVLNTRGAEVCAAFLARDHSNQLELLRAAFSSLGHESVLLHSLLPTTDAAPIRFLLDAGLSAAAVDASGETALHRAVSADVAAPPAAAVLELLVSSGAPVDAADVDGWTALHLAAEQLRSDDVADLLRLGAHPALRNDDGLLPGERPSWRRDYRPRTAAQEVHAARIDALLAASRAVHAGPPLRGSSVGLRI